MNRSESQLKDAFRGAHFVIAAGHFDYFGGAERQAVLLAEQLVSAYECRVTFLGWGGDGVFAKAAQNVGCQTEVFPLNLKQPIWGKAIQMNSLTRFIRKSLKPDYLLPFVGMHCKIIGSVWKRTGAKFCWWNQRDEGRLLFGTKREQQLMRSLPAIVSNSIVGRDFLVDKFGLRKDRVRVINNGIIVPERRDAGGWRHSHGISPQDLVFTMVANLTKYKEHGTLLHAFAGLKKTDIGKRARLVLAGRHGDQAMKLKALAYDLNLSDSVMMPGGLPSDQVEELLTDSDIVVHSSILEGCPNGALEAMAQGRCVLGTDIPGMRQALGNEMVAECLAPPHNSEALTSRMLKMAESKQRRDFLGEQNLHRIKEVFSVDEMVSKVLTTVLDYRVI